MFGPIFRYFDVFDRINDFGILAGKPKILAFRQALSARPSVRAAVSPDYNSRLWNLSRMMAAAVENGATQVEDAQVGVVAPRDLN